MSMRRVEKQKTNDSQKIEKKKIDNYDKRMYAFSNGKSRIKRMMNEIVTMSDVDAAFLVFSETGKPYTFANPSMEEVADRLMNPSRLEPSKKQYDAARSVIEAHKKQKIAELTKKLEASVKELDKEKKKRKLLKKLGNENKLENQWWNTPLRGLSVDALEQRHQVFVELYDALCDVTLSKSVKDNEALASNHWSM